MTDTEPFTNTPAEWATACLEFVGKNIARIPDIHPTGILIESVRAAELASLLLDIQVKLDARDFRNEATPAEEAAEGWRRLGNIRRYIGDQLLINEKGSTLRRHGDAIEGLSNGDDWISDEQIAGAAW